MRTGFLITARLKSTRLPKKVVKLMHGRPMIAHMLDRLKLAGELEEIVICTSTVSQDDPLAEIAEQEGVKCFRGDGEDVLARLAGAAKLYGLDYIVNITADCPFVDPEYVDKIVDTYRETDADLIRVWDLPHGAFSYGIKVDALNKVVEIKNSSHTEVWGKYFTDTGLFRVLDFDVVNEFHKRPGLRMTLDYPEDWRFFQTIFDVLYEEGKVFTLDQILTLLDKEPDIVEINRHCGKNFFKKYTAEADIELKKSQSVKSAVVIGCGSIGQRHIKNLKTAGIKSILALRSREGHYKELPAELEIVEIDSWDDMAERAPDIGIIATPTSMHLKGAIKVIPHVKGLLIEKPLSHGLEEVDQVVKSLEEYKVVSFMGHNLMFHPIIKAIKKFMASNDIGNILNIQCQFGQWLPDWHPYEDYTKAYYARKDLGGGVALSLIHEIHLVVDLAGKPLEVSGMVSKSELLNLDVDVISDVMVRHKTGCVSQVHLDYMQKPSHRSGLISFERGWVSYDFNESRVVAQGPNDKCPVVIWSDKSYDMNEMYLEEIETFIEYVQEGRVRHQFDVHGGVESLRLVEALFESHANKKIVGVDHDDRFEF